MKHSTDDIIRGLKLRACGDQYDLLSVAAERLEQLTMPDDATFARIVDAMQEAVYDHGDNPPDRMMRNAYRAAIRAVES